MFKGVYSVFANKKWVFAYIITFLAFKFLESSDIMAVLAVLIPVTLGASSFDKSKFRHKSD